MARNKEVLAIDAIRETNNFQMDPRKDTLSVRNAIIAAVFKGYSVGPFPEANATLDVVGQSVNLKFVRLYRSIEAVHKAGLSVVKAQDLLIFKPLPEASIELFQTLMKGNDGLADVLASAIRKWEANAGGFAKKRAASARTQMESDGASEDEINALIADPGKLRRYIAERTRALRNKLGHIQAAKENVKASLHTTVKDKALYEKHRQWFESSGELDVDSYYPNDNAVPYAIMFADVVEVVATHPASEGSLGSLKALKKAVSTFMATAARVFEIQSNRAAISALREVANFDEAGCAMGSALRAYFNDDKRWEVAKKAIESPMLQTCTQRTGMRFERLAALFFGLRSAFTIHNAEIEDMGRLVLELDAREKRAQEALKECRIVNKGAPGLSRAEGILWSVVMNRHRLIEPILGRNDLSVAATACHVIGLGPPALEQLQPRPWAWGPNSHTASDGAGAAAAAAAELADESKD